MHLALLRQALRLALLVLSLAFVPAIAQAGIGTSIGFGSVRTAIRGPQAANFFGSFLPSLDYRADPLHLQFHVLEFVDGIADENIFLGVNGYYEINRQDMSGDWNRVVQPGASVDILQVANAPLFLMVLAESRFGIEANGFGVHLVPSFGVLIGDSDTELVVGGTLQAGVWF